MRKLFLIALLSLPLAIGGCGSGGVVDLVKAWGSASTTEVPITKAQAQQALADAQKVHAIVVRSQIGYLDLPPCGLTPASPKPPFCASLKVSRQMTAYDRAFSATMEAAQNDVNTLGDNPTVLATATRAVQLALATYKNFTEANTQGVKP